MQELKNFIKSKIDLDETELNNICNEFRHLDVGRDKNIFRKGQQVTSYYFVKKGALRIYFFIEGKETTAWFAFENSFFTDLTSLKSGSPSQYNVQAMEDCEILYIEFQTMERFYEKYPVLQKFGRLIWEEAFTNVVNGIIGFQTLTAKERYLMALKDSNLMERVPLQHLASFLGITKTSLSRLRKEIR